MTDLSTKQKMQIMEVYVDHLRAKAEIGIQPTAEEIALVEAGVADIQSDIRDVVEALLPPFSAVANAADDAMQTIAEAFDDE